MLRRRKRSASPVFQNTPLIKRALRARIIPNNERAQARSPPPKRGENYEGTGTHHSSGNAREPQGHPGRGPLRRYDRFVRYGLRYAEGRLSRDNKKLTAMKFKTNLKEFPYKCGEICISNIFKYKFCCFFSKSVCIIRCHI